MYESSRLDASSVDADSSALVAGQIAAVPAPSHQERLVEVCVHKLLSQLPHRAGQGRLWSLESSHDGVLDTVKALQALCRHNLPHAVMLLQHELEAIIKMPASQSTGASPSLISLQAQMLVAQLMAKCLLEYREHFRANRQVGEENLSLDDRTAKQLIGTASFFLKQYAIHEGKSPTHLAYRRPLGGISRVSVLSMPTDPSIVMQDLAASTSTIISCVSEARWDLMLTKLRGRLAHYSSADDSLDLSEVPFFELCSLDEHRLSALLSELVVFPTLRRNAQMAIADAVRAGLSNYLRDNPTSLQVMYEEQRKTAFSGQPEILFDLLYAAGDSGARRTVFWPLLAWLLALCPDTVAQIIMFPDTMPLDTRTTALARKFAFLEGLRRSFASENTAEVGMAQACYAVLCKAASYTCPSQSLAIRTLVSDMETHVKAQVLQIGRLPTPTDNSSDPRLAPESLIALTLLQFPQVSSDVLPRLLARNTSYQTKIVALQSCREMLDGEICARWHPRAEQLAEAIQEPVVGMLHSIVTSVFGQDSAGRTVSQPHSRFMHQIADDESEYTRLTLLLLQLIELHPSIALSRPEASEAKHILWSADQLQRTYTHSLSRTVALLACLASPHFHRKVQQQSLATLLALTFCSDDCDAQIALVLARNFFQTTPRPRDINDSLSLCTQWLEVGAARGLLQSRDALVQAFMEAVGLRGLCSVDEVTRDACKELFAKLAQHAGFDSDTHRHNITRIAEALANDDAPVVGGTVAHSKHHLKVWKVVQQPTVGLCFAWIEARKRWISLAGRFGVPEYIEAERLAHTKSDLSHLEGAAIDDGITSEWIQLSGFLISTLHLYARSSDLEPDTLQVAQELLGYSIQDLSTADMVDLCLKDMVALLDSEHPRVRDAARELLASNLDTTYLDLAAKLFRNTLDNFLEYCRLETASSEVTLFFDQTLVVLGGILSRADDGSMPAKQSVTIEEHLLAAAYYSDRQELCSTSTRLKTQICKASAARLRLPHPFETAGHIVRNALMRFILAFAQGAYEAGGDKLASELATYAVSAIRACSQGLILTRQSDVTQEPRSDACLVIVVYQRLSRLLANATSRLSALEEVRPLHGRSQGSRQSVRAVSSLAPWTSEISDLCQAIANVISANIRCSSEALHQLAEQARHDAHKAYALQLAVRDRPSWKEQPRMAESVYDGFIDAICAPDLELALAIVNVANVEHENVTDLVLDVLASRGLRLKLIKAIVEKEIQETDHESTLFRGNTPATRLLTAFARSEGYSYARFLVSSLLATLAAQPVALADHDMHAEADPDDEGLVHLEALTKAFLGLICDTVSYIPPPIRELCHHIQRAVHLKYPDSAYTAIGGWIFLRYINPSIISPDLVDVPVPSESKDIRRALLLVTKLLQALSNNIRFKEPGMKTLNPFVESHILDMTAFLGEVSTPVEPSSTLSQLDSPLPVTEPDKELLFRFVWSFQERIGSTFLSASNAGHSLWQGPQDHILPKQAIWANLTDTLWSIHRAAAAKQPDQQLDSRTQSFEDIRLAHPSYTCDSHPFDGLRISVSDELVSFYVNMASFKRGRTDYDELLDLLRSKAQGRQWDAILDVSRFDLDNSVPLTWLDAFCFFCQSNAPTRIIYFRPNCTFTNWLKRVIGIYAASSASVRPDEDQGRQRDLANYIKTMQAAETETKLDQLSSGAGLGAVAPLVKRPAPEEVSFRTTAVLMTKKPIGQPCVLKVSDLSIRLEILKSRIISGNLQWSSSETLQLCDLEAIVPIFSQYASNDLVLLMRGGSRIHLQEIEDYHGLLATIEDRPSRASNFHRDASDVSDSQGPSILDSLLVGCLTLATAEDPDLRKAGAALLRETLSAWNLMPEADLRIISLSWYDVNAGGFPEIWDSLFQQRTLTVPRFVSAAVQSCCRSVADTSHAVRILSAIRPGFMNLHHLLTEDVEGIAAIAGLLRDLTTLSIQNEWLNSFLISRIWPLVLKTEGVVVLAVEVIISFLGRVNLSEKQRLQLIEVLPSSPAIAKVASSVLTSLQKIIDQASLEDALGLAESSLWRPLQALLAIHNGLSVVDPRHNLPRAGDIVFIIACLVGLGCEDDRQRASRAARLWLQCMQSSGDGSIIRTSAEAMDDALSKLDGVAQVTVLDDAQDGRAMEISTTLDTFFGIMIDAMSAAEVSTDTRLVWHARLASLCVRFATSSDSTLQSRSLLLLSQLQGSPRIITALTRNLSVALKHNMSAAALQAYLICLWRHLPHAGNKGSSVQLFWLSVYTSQAHSVLFAPSIKLMLAAVTYLAKAVLPNTNVGLHSLLIDGRTGTALLQDAVKRLDASIGIEFSETNFSFAMAFILVKALHEERTRADAIFLLKLLAISSDDRLPDQDDGELHQPGSTISDRLGYLIPLHAMTAVPAAKVSVSDLAHIADLPEPPQDKSYLPLLQNVDAIDNESLILASCLSTSLVAVARSNAERSQLLCLVQEFAERAPAVVALLADRLIPFLSLWIASSHDAALLRAARSLLQTLSSHLVPDPDDQSNVSSYLSVLGFPAILECASYETFVSVTTDSLQDTRYKLHCCADLLAGFAASSFLA